jgi:hypothetical protein
MLTAGNAWQFFDDLLPDDFVPELLELVLRAWQKVEVFKIPDRQIEIRISALLKDRMVQEIDAGPDLPFLVVSEQQVTDPVTGKQESRIDFDVHHRAYKIKGQKPYFTFEAKPLRCPDANNDEYIDEMKRFITDEKKVAPAFCGMLGYVMDGEVAKAFHSLQKSIKKKAVDLGMLDGSCMTPCGDLPHPPHGVTDHDCAARNSNLVLHHLLLAVVK